MFVSEIRNNRVHALLAFLLLSQALAFTLLHPNTGGFTDSFTRPAPQCWDQQTASGRSLVLLRSSPNKNDASVGAGGFSAIQRLFNKYCDEDGLMGKSALTQMPPFSGMLKEEDLVLEELEDIWNAAPKFPDVSGEETRIDVDSFVQIYRDVDDLFEDQENDVEAEANKGTRPADESNMEDGDEESDKGEDTLEAELEGVYESICDDAGLVSKATLKDWDEVQKLLDEGLLGEDEFDDLWSKSQKSPGSSAQLLDVDGFLSFNVALDALFELDDDDEGNEQEEPPKHSKAKSMVEGDDLPPGVLFSAIADEDYLVGMDELKFWAELQDMLEEGDLLASELQAMYDQIEKTESGKLNEETFIKLYEQIDAMFEDDEEGEQQASNTQSSAVKEDLIGFIDIIIDDDMLPCGLDCTEKDKKQILNIVEALEGQSTNIIAKKNGNIDLDDLAGTWELLYSSSAAMKFNHGLSGIGGSVPNGKFGGLQQTFKASKFLTDVEYKEHIEVIPSSASFDVTVTGSWDIRSSVSIFTGQPSIIVEIEPDRVTYGPTSTRGDHWKSLGPMNMLDLTYLDEDFRVMRGCTSADSVFIFKRV